MTVDYLAVFKAVELIAVDDGSTDNSFRIISELSKEISVFTFVKLDHNKGKGAAMKAGFDIASGDLMIVQDADLELLPEDIIPMANLLLKENLSLVNGSRFYANKNHTGNKKIRNFANSFFSLFASVLNFTKITDLTCGYKLFTKEFYQSIELKEKRFGVEAELLTKALKFNKKRVKEYPVHYYPREISGGKKIRYTDGIRVMWSCLKYKFVN